ncbi:hypothetical protein QYM41_05395 [Kocuria sp. CPCC 205268]|uniref:hypothetical protein n=1 Tax=Kocuria oxytropis TaxID=3058913 RepID=UPI0034D4DE1F
MEHSLSVVVRIERDTGCVHLVVTGDLTERNHRTLPPLVGRARALFPEASVVVDLTGAQHVEPEGLDLLRWSLDQDLGPESAGPVHVVTRPVPFGSAEGPRPSARARTAVPGTWTGTERGGVAA